MIIHFAKKKQLRLSKNAPRSPDVFHWFCLFLWSKKDRKKQWLSSYLSLIYSVTMLPRMFFYIRASKVFDNNMKIFRVELKNWPATKFGPLYQEPSTSVFGNDSAKNVQRNWAAHLCLSCLVCTAFNNKGKQAFSLFHLSTIVQAVRLLALFAMATHRPLKLNQESRKHVWRFQTMNSRRSLYNFGGASPWTLHGLIVLLLYWHATVRSRRAARQWSHGPCGFISAGQEQLQGRHFLAEKRARAGQ